MPKLSDSNKHTTNNNHRGRAKVTGEFIKLVHQCEKPDVEKQGLGSIWQCECGKQWTSRYFRDFTGWYWSNRPEIIYTKELTIWQKLTNRLRGI
jgi:hypothetical protein